MVFASIIHCYWYKNLLNVFFAYKWVSQFGLSMSCQKQSLPAGLAAGGYTLPYVQSPVNNVNYYLKFNYLTQPFYSLPQSMQIVAIFRDMFN